MDILNLFRDIRLNKTEIAALRYIQNNTEQCLKEGVRTVAAQCLSNPSSLVRLAKKLGFSGWLEMVYFIKFNITQPRMDVTTDRDFMRIQPEESIQTLFRHLRSGKLLIHGSGFSQLIAQYIYNKFLVTGVNASLALWPDYEILEQKTAAKFDAIWIISKSGRSSSALSWVKSLEHKNIELVCFTGDHQSPLAQAASTAIIVHDPQKYDDDIYWSNPFFGYCILSFEQLLKQWFEEESAARK
ncbi:MULTISPECIES: MurR/RpiR family transcriptional regulator [unclassified Enterobacter]|uniref:MurR/RpiR family transcriptional regulator n=1 Tax=unclassified Enterobacter TaxID=2608935 RepID=UPI0008E61D86|nr:MULTISPECIES: SIS domain-containing protein [unclassified Enterobacter]SFR12870.1 transcriptional regulator, RpiR family [Enterobacter sp. kpr-6]